MEIQKQLQNSNYFRQRIRRFALLCLILYVVFLSYITLFTYNYYVYGPSFNVVMFDSIKLMMRSGNVWLFIKNVIGNVLLFFPLGFLLPILHRKMKNFFRMFLTAFLASSSIEFLQFAVANRIFDIDDILLNTIGAIIGFITFYIAMFFYKLLSSFVKA